MHYLLPGDICTPGTTDGVLLPSKWWVSHLPDLLVFAVMKHIWHKLFQVGFPGKQTLVQNMIQNSLELNFLLRPTLVGWFQQLLLEVYWPWIWVVQWQSVCCVSLQWPAMERSRMEISASNPSVTGSPSVSDEHDYLMNLLVTFTPLYSWWSTVRALGLL